MEWKNTKNTLQDIPVNTNILITDGYEVFVGFYDSMHEWRMIDQELCIDIDFDVIYWMEFPLPPKEH